MKSNCILPVALLALQGTTWAATKTWIDSGSARAWFTTANWDLNVAPTASDIAQFANSGSATTCGLNMSTAGGNVAIQAVEVTSARARNLKLGNSSPTVGTLTLNGGTVNGVANTILRNAATGTTLTLQDNETGTGKTMGLVIGNAAAVIDAVGPINISSKISGNGFTKTGAGTLTLSGANDYTGATTISVGTLALGAANALAGSSVITLQATAILDASATGGLSLGAAQTLAGTGSIQGNLAAAGTLSPGNSPGSLTIHGNTTWLPGGNYNWQIGDADAGAGSGWDTLVIDGTLDLSNLSLATPYYLNLWSLSATVPADLNGDVPDFLNTQDYTWSIATAGGGIEGFDPASFVIEMDPANGTGGFSNMLSPQGSFALKVSGNSLNLVYAATSAVPEPASSAASAVLLASGLLLRRRSKIHA